MQFILDVTRVFRYRMKQKLMTGIDRVTMAYVRQYGSQAHALVRWCGSARLLPKAESQLVFAWLMNPDATIKMKWVFLHALLKPVDLRLDTPIFLMNTGHVAPTHDDYVRLIHRYAVKPIFFVHDLIPIDYPEYCFVGEDKRHQEKIDFVLRHAHGIITNSAETREALKAYCPEHPPMEVAWLASSFTKNLVVADSARPLEKPYFVLNSTIEPRKNHLLILHVWRRLCQIEGENTPHLFVIGKRGWECEQVLDLLERSKRIRPFVTEINDCSDERLRWYIKHAQAVLMPSFAEGFGLGLVEAFALNVPVIASDLSVFREIAQDVPEYADAIDGMRWQALIQAYAKVDSTLRAAQLERLKGYAPPSWEAHFQLVDTFLQGLEYKKS